MNNASGVWDFFFLIGHTLKEKKFPKLNMHKVTPKRIASS